jgi:hypothetical protein
MVSLVARRQRWILGVTLAASVAGAMAVGARASEPPGPDGRQTAGSDGPVTISVLTYRHWIHDGTLFAVGEVRNTSAHHINAQVRIRFSPGHDSADLTLVTLVGIPSLAPGGRSPFYLEFSPFAPASTSIVEITATGFWQRNPVAAIGVSSIGGFASDPDLETGAGDTIRVQIHNGTDRDIEVTAIAAFRDAAGKVTNMGVGLNPTMWIPVGGTAFDWVSGGPSGQLAFRADVDVQARFVTVIDPYERIVSWQNWFRDIDASPLRMSIAWIADRGITTGCTRYRFCPSANVTRAQMAMFLDRALDLPSATTDYFDDDDGKTGEASINSIALAGITVGCGPRRYCPSAYVTRAQMALFLDRAWDFPSTSTDFFDDDDGKTGEAAINRLAAAKITGGCGTRRYCPSAYVTRAEMAAFLKRVLD